MKLCIVLVLLLEPCVLLSAQLGTASIGQRRIPEGSDVIVPCENEGSVSWSKLADGKRERILTAQAEQVPDKHIDDPDHRYRVMPNLTLVIKEASVSDSGIYYCNATPVVDLQVTRLKGKFDQRRIPEGSDVIVPCENEGRVSWSKLADGKRERVLTARAEQVPDKHIDDPDHRYRVMPNLTLVIKEVSVSDSGIYYCNATPVVDLQVTPLKEMSTDDMITSVRGGVNGVKRELLVCLIALFLFLATLW